VQAGVYPNVVNAASSIGRAAGARPRAAPLARCAHYV